MSKIDSSLHISSIYFVLQVRESKVQVAGESFYSMEMVGPVLPSNVQQLCDLLHGNVEQFSLTLASHESTKAFTRSGHYSTSE